MSSLLRAVDALRWLSATAIAGTASERERRVVRVAGRRPRSADGTAEPRVAEHRLVLLCYGVRTAAL